MFDQVHLMRSHLVSLPALPTVNQNPAESEASNLGQKDES